MKTPLLYKVYRALRRGWKRMTPEAQQTVQAFVASQKTANGYMNAGGHEDAYYGQFGEVLEAVFTPSKLLRMKIHLTVQESRNKDTIYGRFFDFLEQEMKTGGFYASEAAPIPDLLSTAVALFTLRLIGAEFKDATQFIQAHWLDNGGFAPTLLDDYSDVEYVFYGLLALGTK